MIYCKRIIAWIINHWASIVGVYRAAVSHAGPFLRCDPQAGVEFYIVLENGTPKRVEAQTDGSLRMENPVAGASYFASACNASGCGPSAPVSSTRPAGKVIGANR